MILIFLALLGLIIGSFLAALTWRSENNISIAKGRSFCPKCKHPIAWYDNIPVLSYFFLGGKCRNCKKKISPRYPVIELSTMASFVLLYLLQSKLAMQIPWLSTFPPAPLVLALILAAISIGVIVTDIEEQIIPDELSFAGLIISFLFLIFSPAPDIWVRLLTMASGAAFLLLLNLFTKGKGMGLGDVKFALFPGLVLGFPQVIVWLFVSFVLGAVVGVAMLFLKRLKFGAKIAFGPFLVIGFWIVLLFGDTITNLLFPYLFV